jgi:transposase
MRTNTIAVDLAKSVFELAIADGSGHVVRRQRLTRVQFERFLRDESPAHVVMEACGTSHFWGRRARTAGHRVTLLPAQYVRPFVRRQKTDRTDTAGLLDAIRSDGLTAVPIKTVTQQELQALHRVREQWMTTRTARINALRGLFREFGIALGGGAHRALVDAQRVLDESTSDMPGRLRGVLRQIGDEIHDLESRIEEIDKELRTVAKQDSVAGRLMGIPGIGVMTATALLGSVADIYGFRRGRQFASWLGLTPREDSSGERRRLGGITKQGNIYLRCLLTHGARSVLLSAHRAQTAKRRLSRLQDWALAVANRRGHNRAAIAVANKIARIVWAVWSLEATFDAAFSEQPAA